MACQSVLIVGGRIDEETSQEKLCKLLYDGLVAAFGGDLDNLDAQFMNCLAKPLNSVDSKEFGLTLEYAVHENIFIRILFNPTSDQLRFGLQEAFNHAIGSNGDSVIEYPVTPSTMGKVSIVYNGQLNGFTGDWLLQDSSFNGSNLLSWLDSEAAMSWWPYLKKFSNFGDQIKLHIITPIAGSGTCWPVDKSGRPHTVLTQINARMAKIDILIEASWRLNGKPLNINGNLSCFEGLRSFVDHITHQHPITIIQSDLNSLSIGTALNTARPVIYVFPSHGVASQSCALFAIQGFTALLGGSYTSQSMPNWWPMVKHLPKLDVTLLPDWCPSNIFTYRFMMQLLKSEHSNTGTLGEILVPPGNSSSDGLSDVSTGLIVTPPSVISGPHQGTWISSSSLSEIDTNPSPMVLYSKLGWGELKLQPLSHRTGLLLMLESIPYDFPSQQPLCIVIPSVQLANTNPVQNLTRFIKAVCQIPQLSGPTSNRTTKSAVKVGVKPLTRTQPARLSKPISHPATQKEASALKTTSTMNVKPSPTRPISSTPAYNQRITTSTSPSKPPLKKPIHANTANSKLVNNLHEVNSHQKRPLSSVDTKKPLNALKPHIATVKPLNSELKTTTTTTNTTRPSSASRTTPLTKPKTTTPTTAERLTAHSNLVNHNTAKVQTRKSEPTRTHLNKLQTKKSSVNMKNNLVLNTNSIKEDEINGLKGELVSPPLPPSVARDISLNDELKSVDQMLTGWGSLRNVNQDDSLDNLSIINQHIPSETSLHEEQEFSKQPHVSHADAIQQLEAGIQEEYKVHKVIKENNMLAEESDEQSNNELECELKQTLPISCDDSLAEGTDEEQEEGDKELSFCEGQHRQNQSMKNEEEGITPSVAFHYMQSYKTSLDTPFDMDMIEQRIVSENIANKTLDNVVMEETKGLRQLEEPEEINTNIGADNDQTCVDYPQKDSSVFHLNKQEASVTEQDDDIPKENLSVESGNERYEGAEQHEPEEEGEEEEEVDLTMGTQNMSNIEDDLTGHHFDSSMNTIQNELTPSIIQKSELKEQEPDYGMVEMTHEPQKLEEELEEVGTRVDVNDDQTCVDYSQEDSSVFLLNKQEASVAEQDDDIPKEHLSVESGNERYEGAEQHEPEEEGEEEEEEVDLTMGTQNMSNIEDDLTGHHFDSSMNTMQNEFTSSIIQTSDLEEQNLPYKDNLSVTTSSKANDTFYGVYNQPLIIDEFQKPTEHSSYEGDKLQPDCKNLTYDSMIHLHDELSSFHTVTNIDTTVSIDSVSNFTESQLNDSIEQSHLENKVEEQEMHEPQYPPQPVEEKYEDDLQNVTYVVKEQSLDQLRHELSSSSFKDVVVEKSQELQHYLNNFHMQEEVGEDDILPKKPVDLNQIDESNIIGSSDFLTEVIPLSNEEITINSNQSTIDDTIKTTNNESVFDQTQIDLVVHQQKHLTTSIEDVEQVTNLDGDDNADGDLYSKTYDQISVLQGEGGEEKEEANISVVKQVIEPEVVGHEYYVSIEHDHRHEDSEGKHQQFHSHIEIDYLQPDHHKDNEEVHSDIDEMEKEFVIPYQQNQEQIEHDVSILSHSPIDDNLTTDENDRKEHSLYEFQSKTNTDLKAKHTTLEQNNIERNDVNTLLDASLLSTTRTTGVEPTTYQVDSSTDQIFDNTQTMEPLYTNNHVSNEANFVIQREMETDQIEEVESYQKVDSTTYYDSYILGHDSVQNDVENHTGIHENLHQEVGDSLHVYTTENASDDQQQQFISPDSEISVDSIVETQPQYKEHELECDQHQEQHSEADSLISSPNRPISPNYNIVSSTQRPNDEDEGGYVGDDTVVHYNDLVTMSKQSEIEFHQQEQRNYADNQPYENSTLNGFSTYSNPINEQQLYSTVPTDDVAEMMMQRMQVMSTDFAVNNVTNIETTFDTPSSYDGHPDIEQQQQQYFNGNTIFQTNDELKGIGHSMNISTTSTNHHLHDNDIAYTNGFVTNNVNGSGNFCLETSENNEDDNQDENRQNNWDKTNNHYLSETAIDDIGFSNFYNKDISNECIKTSHLTHSYPGEENDGRLPSDMVTTTPPPSATSNTPSKEIDNFSKFFMEKDQSTQDVHHNSSQHCSPTEEVFDPLKSWGHPLGLPAPVPPITNHSKLHQQSTLTKRVRSADTGGKTLTTGDSNDPMLPPGPAVYLDAIWVPNYLARVPQSLMVEFFIRIRAKLYILSGEALHPNIVESLILAKTKWNSDDVAYLCRCDADSPDALIMILPTDEPKEWIRWLETPCGRLDEQKGSDRLAANHFRLLPAANLCSTQFNAGDTVFECDGLRVEF
ncbi:hypothetical protein MN116_008798 [Schistosoma mekongi]|uniref:Uncharacterized protein n=1 Tax=Schistosoma mekongi TaxID=38744 RepID=A0AAE1Z692_SCHME|nr:hypothetical protein MN116_008798 [Schistosoma mekongi]